jgi:hypothetical protein
MSEQAQKVASEAVVFFVKWRNLGKFSFKHGDFSENTPISEKGVAF